MEIHKAIWMNRFLCFTKKKETLLLPSFLPQKKNSFFKRTGQTWCISPPTPPQPKPPWCPWRIETSVGWVVEHSPSHWKNMRRIVKLHENRNPKRSGWEFHKKILELPDTYPCIDFTCCQNKGSPRHCLWTTKTTKRVVKCLGSAYASPVFVRSDDFHVEKSRRSHLHQGATPTHLENSDFRNPQPLATHPPDFDIEFTVHVIWSPKRAPSATNHGSKPHGPCHRGASPAKLSELSWRRFAPWMAEAEMDGRTLAWRIFF